MKKELLIAMILTTILLANPVKAGITGVSLVDDTLFDNKGKMWIINWDRMWADYISATLTPQDLKEETGYASENSFTLKMSSGDEWAMYPLHFYKGIYKVDIIASEYKMFGWKKEDLDNWARQYCWDADEDGVHEYVMKHIGGVIILQGFCIKRAEYLGPVYSIGTEKGMFSTSWTFQASGKEPKTVKISNDNNVKAGLTTDLGPVKIRWSGMLTTGQRPPDPSDLLVSRRYSTGTWNILDQEVYLDYRAKLQDDGWDIVYDYVTGKYSTKEEALNEINTPARNIFDKWTSKKYTEFRRDIITFYGNYFKLDLKEQVYIPSFTVYVDGDYYLKVILPKGKPEVTSVNCPRLEEDKRSYVTATISNVGDAEDSFEVWISCSPSDKISITDPRKTTPTIYPGKSYTVSFEVIAHDIPSGSIKYTCEVCAKSFASGLQNCNSDSNYAYNRPVCNEGEQTYRFVNGVYQIYICQNGEWVVFKTCNPGETVEWDSSKNSYVCKSAGPPPEKECVTDDDCYKKFGVPPSGQVWVCEANKCVLKKKGWEIEPWMILLIAVSIFGISVVVSITRRGRYYARRRAY